MFKFAPVPFFKTKTTTTKFIEPIDSYDLDIRFRYRWNNKGQRVACLSTIRHGEKIYWGISRQNPKLGENRQLLMLVSEGRALKAFSQNEDSLIGDTMYVHSSNLRGWVTVEDVKRVLEFFENEDYKG